MNGIYDAIAQAVQAKVNEGYNVTINEVFKNNDTVRHAVNIMDGEEKIVPQIYVDKMVDGVQKGDLTVEDVADRVLEFYEEVKLSDAVGKDYTDMINDKDYVLNNLRIRLVNKKSNEKNLEKRVYREYLDLAICYFITISLDAEGLQSVGVTKDLMDNLGLTEQELYDAASKNLLNEGGNIRSLIEVMCEFMGEQAPVDENEYQMLLISNEQCVYGASQMLNKDLMAQVSERLGGDFYIIPSSVHEVLAIRADEGDSEMLSDMITDVNTGHVQSEDVLQNHAYLYHDGEIKVA